MPRLTERNWLTETRGDVFHSWLTDPRLLDLSQRKVRLLFLALFGSNPCPGETSYRDRFIDYAYSFMDGDIHVSQVPHPYRDPAFYDGPAPTIYEVAINSLLPAVAFRDVLGNPFRPRFFFSKECGVPGQDLECQDCGDRLYQNPLACRRRERYLEGHVRELILACRNGEQFTSVLADALEDLGFSGKSVLRHLRGYSRCSGCLGRPLPDGCKVCSSSGWVLNGNLHFRGCWAVEYLLGLS